MPYEDINDLQGDEFAGDEFAGADEFAGDEFAGADEFAGDDILGALTAAQRRAVSRRTQRARQQGAARQRQQAQSRARMPGTGLMVRTTPPMMQIAPGLSAPSAGKIQMLPIGQFNFAVAGATFITWIARPQIPCRPTRLVIDFARNNAGGSATGLLTLTQFVISTRSQLAGAGPVPAGAFGPQAWGVRIICDPCQPGTDVVVTVAISAAPTVAGDSVDVAAVLFCDAVA